MAVSYITGSSVAYGNRTNTNITAPVGIQNGDLLLTWYDAVINGPTPPTPTPPAGFNIMSGFPLHRADGAGFSGDLYIWTKTANGESGDYLVTSSNANTDAFMAVIRGAGAFSPAPTVDQGLGATSTAPGLTTLSDNSLVIYYVAQWNFPGIVPPGGTTPVLTTRLDGSVTLLFVSTGIMSPAGATGNKVATLPHIATDPWISGLISIAEPSPSAGGAGGALIDWVL